ncbi:tyrosine-protein phosphatase [Leucobacter albus]|uniref:Tyrosine-protein phosphatase n=1 Tax=Leucobacter albus TaxID=272210 RepID=A0ABW3TIY4_9MICO
MTETLDRRVPLATVPNMRTLGGLPVAGGVVADGLIFRSATLAAVAPADGEALLGLGIRRVVDFRTEGERRSAPDVLPGRVSGVALDVMGDHARDLSASLAHLGLPGTGSGGAAGAGDGGVVDAGGGADAGADAGSGAGSDAAVSREQRDLIRQQVSEVLGEGRGVKLLEESNRLMVSSESALAAYREFFMLLSEPGDYAPTLFHCTTGKDRTGWAAAAFLLLLGADEHTAMADYLQTNADILPMIEPMLERAERGGVDPALLKPVLTVHESMLQAAFDEMRARFGTIEGYFTEGLGLDAARLETLRRRFTTAG